MKAKLRELWAMREEESRRLAESSALAQKVAASDAHMIVEVVNRKT
jgi:hypothetical protein